MSNHLGLTYEVDPQTGFMVDYSGPCPFTPERKLTFIETLRRNLCNTYKSCREIGMDYITYQKHYKLDPVFRDAVNDARNQLNHEVENVVVQRAIEGKSPMWSIYYLNNNWKEKYGPRLSVYSEKSDGIKDIWGKVSAIDAEVVKSASNELDNGSMQALDSKSVDNQQ